MTRPNTRKDAWSEAELAVFDDYESIGATGCAPLLPNRSLRAIRKKAGQLGLRSSLNRAKSRVLHPAAPPSVDTKRQADIYAIRKTRQKRKSVNDRARQKVLAGKTSGQVKHGQTKMAMLKAERDIAEERRRADPLEQAKTILRRRYSPVVSLAYTDKKGPADRYLVGKREVSEQDLLALAQGLVA